VRLEILDADAIMQWVKSLPRKKAARGGQGSDLLISSGTIAIAFRRLRKALNVAKKRKYITENEVAVAKVRIGQIHILEISVSQGRVFKIRLAEFDSRKVCT
jgi:hypothetical protein